MVVGLVSGGTDGGTVGTAFTDAQDMSEELAHTHTMSSHTHTMSNHTHTGADHYHKMGFHVTSGIYNNSTHPYGTEGTVSVNYAGSAGGASATPPEAKTSTAAGTTSGVGTTGSNNDATSGPSTANTGETSGSTVTVSTSDLLAYIQLMAIKKD